MKNYKTILGLLLMVFIVFAGCSKDKIETKREKLLGTWVSIDKTDTLYFTTDDDFFKSSGYMISDHFDYKLFDDSIEIGYRGRLYILIYPTKHKYSIDNNNLVIDFSNKRCYGFPLKEMQYLKEK